MLCHTCNKEISTNQKSRCSRCKNIYYCSTKCQKNDWPTHKLICKENIKEKENKSTPPGPIYGTKRWKQWERTREINRSLMSNHYDFQNNRGVIWL